MKRGWCALLAALPLMAANPAPWTAQWISAPGAPRTEYGVYHFRRVFTLPAQPAAFLVHVSADNRYQLFVNGARVAWGPARGDLLHWRYETVDLARHLRAGRNVLAAVVWNAGADAPLAQVTHQTGFLLQGDGAAERLVDTGAEWSCAADPAYSPIPVQAGRDVPGYYAAGSGERVDGTRYPWGWQDAGFEDSGWAPAVPLGVAEPRGAIDAHSFWMMVPRTIPPMEEHPEPPLRVRRGAGGPWHIPAHTGATVVLDQGYYTTGYPEIAVTGGRGATVSLRYAESLFQPGAWNKGNRDEVEGKEFKGNQDVFLPDGGAHRTWRPLWWRTWRYIELSVKTADDPLAIESLATSFAGYPFVRRATLHTNGPEENELERMLDVSWRTLRVDAHETFMDCAYYEQLQYIGDTRLEALAALTLSGDARLIRNAIELTQATQTADGLTFSRGPSRLPQYIPPFSLLWIGMLHDYWMYQDDPRFVSGMLPATRSILAWFAAHEKGPLPWWNFVDWVRTFSFGVPPIAPDGSSAILDLQLLAAYEQAAEMERSLGSAGLAREYDERIARLKSTVRSRYFDAARGLFRDTPAGSFSQHANALAILTGVAPEREAASIARALAEDSTLTQATLYFRYYVDSALLEAGLGDRFLDGLGPWRDALRLGLTTWPESPEPSRSDAHAWSSHIAIGFFRTMLGIRPVAPGFRRVRIAPHLGALESLSGTMPHPNGEIKIALLRHGGALDATITLPPGVTGDLVWRGASAPLPAGTTHLHL